jgi:hypothetical protein
MSTPAPAPAKKRKWPLILGGGVLLLIVIGALAPNSSSSKPGSSLTSAFPTRDAKSDVTVARCDASDGVLGMPVVTVRITNTTDRTQSYWVTASVNNSTGDRLAEANGAANSIAAGQSANVDLLAGAQHLPAPVTCVVANVTRTPV